MKDSKENPKEFTPDMLSAEKSKCFLYAVLMRIFLFRAALYGQPHEIIRQQIEIFIERELDFIQHHIKNIPKNYLKEEFCKLITTIDDDRVKQWLEETISIKIATRGVGKAKKFLIDMSAHGSRSDSEDKRKFLISYGDSLHRFTQILERKQTRFQYLINIWHNITYVQAVSGFLFSIFVIGIGILTLLTNIGSSFWKYLLPNHSIKLLPLSLLSGGIIGSIVWIPKLISARREMKNMRSFGDLFEEEFTPDLAENSLHFFLNRNKKYSKENYPATECVVQRNLSTVKKGKNKNKNKNKLTPIVFIKNSDTNFLFEILNRILKIRMSLYGAPPEIVDATIKGFLESELNKSECQKLLSKSCANKFPVNEVKETLKEEFYQFIVRVKDETIHAYFEKIILESSRMRSAKPVKFLLGKMKEDGVDCMNEIYKNKTHPAIQRCGRLWAELEQKASAQYAWSEYLLRFALPFLNAMDHWEKIIFSLFIAFVFPYFVAPVIHHAFLYRKLSDLSAISKAGADGVLGMGGRIVSAVALVLVAAGMIIKAKNNFNIRHFDVQSSKDFIKMEQEKSEEMFFSKENFHDDSFIDFLIQRKKEKTASEKSSTDEKSPASSHAIISNQLPSPVSVREVSVKKENVVEVKVRNAYHALKGCHSGTYLHLDRDKHLGKEAEILDAVETQIQKDATVHPEDHAKAGLMRRGHKQKRFSGSHRMSFLQGKKGYQWLDIQERAATAADCEVAGTSCKRVLSPVRVVK